MSCPPAPILTLAPIRGITDAVYRDAFARCFGGFDRAIAPFIQLRQGQPLKAGELRQVAPELNRGMRTIPQVLTNHAPTFLAALHELHAAGHDEVNWNLGCPYPMVAGRGRGSGLLPHPERIDAILGQVLEKAPVRLSVKLRLGYRNPDEFAAVLEVLNRYPLTAVILHARTASQMYAGTVDLERAAQALARCRHPFEYNGDITEPCGFRNLREKLPGAASWMIGRGALADPFLPARLKEKPEVPMINAECSCNTSTLDIRNSKLSAIPTPDARCQQLREFHGQLLDGYRQWLSGPGHLLDKMKEQWTYLALAFAQPRPIIARIRHSGDLAAYAAAVDWAFVQPLVPRK